MNVEIISVGNEVVLGHTINTNASYIAQSVQKIGMVPRYVTTVCDDEKDISEALKNALVRTEIVIVTGGLGPTNDDLTKETVCKCLGKEMIIFPDELRKIQDYFNKINREMTEINKKQAAFPQNAYILPNDCGTAPGCIIEENSCQIILLPGPPKEMQQMLNKYALPYLQEKSKQVFRSLDIHLFGMGESEIATRLGRLLGEFPWGTVATYIGNYEVIVRVVAYGTSKEEVEGYIENTKKDIEICLGEFVIGYNDERLEENVVKLLLMRGYSISTVESCTGGLVAATLINCGGVSSCLKEGIITYSNEAKMKYVGVAEETLKRVGAVSKETAKEMAEGIRKAAGVDIGLSTTGIAGPGGGTQEKPVGLVYIGIAMPEYTEVFKLQLSGSRRDVREKTVKNILFQLYRRLK